MNRETESALIGKWRIEMELWDTDYLDIVERAYIRFDRKGGGEFVFGVVSGMTQEQGRGHSSLKSSGTSPNFFSTTASENSPTFGSPARLNATAPALAGSRDIPSALLIAVPSL